MKPPGLYSPIPEVANVWLVTCITRMGAREVSNRDTSSLGCAMINYFFDETMTHRAGPNLATLTRLYMVLILACDE